VTWDDNQPVCPPWLSISSLEGCVEAGVTQDIDLTVCIEGGAGGAVGPLLGVTNNTLDAILILRIEDGSDIFVSLTGNFLRSCFGMDLDALITLGKEPVLPLETLSEEGRRMVSEGLAARAPGGGGGAADLLGLGDGGAAAALTAAADEAVGVLGSGLEEKVPKEVLRLSRWLQVRPVRKDGFA
jgi:hypothetical protein